MLKRATKGTKSAIVQQGNPVLREKAKPVARSAFGGAELSSTIEAMNDALEAEFDGVAIAAPQIGVSLRIFIISRKAFTLESANDKAGYTGDEKEVKYEKNIVCINPEIIKVSRKKVKVPEGCLSVRWFYGNTLRHEKATLRAFDENGKLFTLGASGLVAQIFQHETDHLNGTLFIDHATDIAELSAHEIAEIEARNKKQ